MIWWLVLAVSLAVILIAAELFTNGVEWVGSHLRLGDGAVGSILAAVGTAMPETLIPVVAILFFGEQAADEVGIGAIMGAPFMLATLAMFVVGTAVLVFARLRHRSLVLNVDHEALGRDIRFFLIAYTVSLLAGLVSVEWARWAIAAGLVLTYAVYVYRHLAAEAQVGNDPNPLHLSHWVIRLHGSVVRRPVEHISPFYFLEGQSGRQPRFRWTLAQTLGSLVLMIAGAYIFVQSVEHISTSIGIPALVLALIIAPVATELPEKFNSVLWVRVGKDTLAMGNITGAMVFQSCLPTALGILFTNWVISAESTPAFVSVVVALVSTVLIFGGMRLQGRLIATWLLVGGIAYAAYLGYLLLIVL